ncbi:hypothetical protein NPIL_667501 [Nephila pilipes]|uniref:Uncharacterized protein n=1 Tax=Nephila pilipes TaxID=299642 RepID=A0A8X6NCF7_NEPPI|nr:hypothetical protein NPIL_667501 [Nephila pilipes]
MSSVQPVRPTDIVVHSGTLSAFPSRRKVKAAAITTLGPEDNGETLCRHPLLIKCFCMSGGSLSTGVFHMACQPSPQSGGGGRDV